MSDLMLCGILRMPIDAGEPLSALSQFVEAARMAADRVEADAAEIDRLNSEVANLKGLLVIATTAANNANAHRERFAAEVEALRKDAERYRWLRENGEQAVGRDRGNGPEWTYNEDLDVLVDSAMAASSGGEGDNE